MASKIAIERSSFAGLRSVDLCLDNGIDAATVAEHEDAIRSYARLRRLHDATESLNQTRIRLSEEKRKLQQRHEEELNEAEFFLREAIGNHSIAHGTAHKLALLARQFPQLFDGGNPPVWRAPVTVVIDRSDVEREVTLDVQVPDFIDARDRVNRLKRIAKLSYGIELRMQLVEKADEASGYHKTIQHIYNATLSATGDERGTGHERIETFLSRMKRLFNVQVIKTED